MATYFNIFEWQVEIFEVETTGWNFVHKGIEGSGKQYTNSTYSASI